MDILPKLPTGESLEISSKGLEYILKNHDPEVPHRNILWTSDFRVQLPVRVKKSGFGSEKPYTVIEMWRRLMQVYANDVALNFQVGANKWESWTYQQYYEQSCTFAKALIALAIPDYTPINIIGFNSPEWAVAFTGSIFGHYVPIGIYTTNGPDACQYIANHSGAQVVVMQDESHLKKYLQVKQKLKNVKYYILWKGEVPKSLDAQFEGKVLTWNELMHIGKNQYQPNKPEDQLESRMDSAKPGNCCTFIYTSGTTGSPKAVMISHDNYTWTADAVNRRFQFDAAFRDGNKRLISMLPLSHVAAQFIDLITAPRVGASLYFTDATALQGNLLRFLLIAKPNIFVCVPRVWEKMEEKIAAIGAQTTGLKRKIADWAKSKSPHGTLAQETGKPLPSMWSIAKRFVFNKIKQNLGLDQCNCFIFSAAPMRESTRSFFMNLNFFLINCYGMSELSGPQTFTNPNAWDSFATQEYFREAGQSLDGLQIGIDKPDSDGNGEICLRGRNVFMGYFKNQQETIASIDRQGFLHSGDIGIVKQNGSLSITGRIKQLIITAGGQNVAPVLIQNQINSFLPILSSAVVIGDKRKYLTVLLCLRLKDKENLMDEVVDYFKEKGAEVKTIQQAMTCKKVKAIIEHGINQANQKAISKAQRIVKFCLLPKQFSIDEGTLTPTLKLKRKIINQKYNQYIEGMYIQAKL